MYHYDLLRQILDLHYGTYQLTCNFKLLANALGGDLTVLSLIPTQINLKPMKHNQMICNRRKNMGGAEVSLAIHKL